MSSQEQQEEIIFQQQEVLWAKIRGYPWWPAFVRFMLWQVDKLHPNNRGGETEYTVFFFGDNTHSRLGASKLRKFYDNYSEFYQKAKSHKKLMNSIQMAEQKLKQNDQNVDIYEEVRVGMKSKKKSNFSQIQRRQSKISEPQLSVSPEKQLQAPVQIKKFKSQTVNRIRNRRNHRRQLQEEVNSDENQAQKQEKIEEQEQQNLQDFSINNSARQPKLKPGKSKLIKRQNQKKQSLKNVLNRTQITRGRKKQVRKDEEQIFMEQQSQDQQKEDNQKVNLKTKVIKQTKKRRGRRSRFYQQQLNSQKSQLSNQQQQKVKGKKQDQQKSIDQQFAEDGQSDSGGKNDEQDADDESNDSEIQQQSVEEKGRTRRYNQNLHRREIQRHRQSKGPRKRGRPKKRLLRNNSSQEQERQDPPQSINIGRNRKRPNTLLLKNKLIKRFRKASPIKQSFQRQASITSKTLNPKDLKTLQEINSIIQTNNRLDLVEYLRNIPITTQNVKQILDLEVSNILQQGQITADINQLLQILKIALLYKYFPDDLKHKKRYEKFVKKRTLSKKEASKQQTQEKQVQDNEQQNQIRKKTVLKIQKFLKYWPENQPKVKQMAVELETMFENRDKTIGDKYKSIAFKVLSVLKDKSETYEQVIVRLNQNGFE